MSLTRNQRGFSPLLLLLILLILLLLAFAGWRVWGSRDDADGGGSSASSSAGSGDADEPAAAPEPDYVKPLSEVYRVVRPTGWEKATCADATDLLFLAPSADKLGRCGSDSGGTVAISKASGDVSHPAAYYTSDAHYSGVSYSAITFDGISGYKVSYTISADFEVGPGVGSQQTQYVLFDGTNSFIIVYTRLPGEPDLAATVQTMAETFDKL